MTVSHDTNDENKIYICTWKIWELALGSLIPSLFFLTPSPRSQSVQWTPRAVSHSCFPLPPLDGPPLVTSLAPTSLDPGRSGSGMPPASAQSCFWNFTCCPDRGARSSTCPPFLPPPAAADGFLASPHGLLWQSYFPLVLMNTLIDSFNAKLELYANMDLSNE